MPTFLEMLKRCAENHTFDSGDPDCQTVLDQLYRAYAESRKTTTICCGFCTNRTTTYGGVFDP